MNFLLPLVVGGRVSLRRATYFSLLRQKKVGKRKATLLSASLRFAAGNLRCSIPAGVRRTRFTAFRSGSGGPDPASICAPRRLQKGRGEDGTSLRSATKPPRRVAPRWLVWALDAGRAKQRPVWFAFPSVCAEERSVSRIRARSCLSEASSARPRETRAPQVARSAAEGRRQWGCLFFAYFLLAKQKKVSPPPGGHPGPETQTTPRTKKGASQ